MLRHLLDGARKIRKAQEYLPLLENENCHLKEDAGIDFE